MIIKGIYMLKKTPQLESVLVPTGTGPVENVDIINSYINKNTCEYMNVDISFMNAIDASYVSTLCSTNHYIKYPQGKITWKVASSLVEEFSKDLSLGNCKYII